MSNQRYNELKQLLEEAEEDFSKFYDKHNKAAGTRVRGVMQDIKKKAQDIRIEIQDIKNNELS